MCMLYIYKKKKTSLARLGTCSVAKNFSGMREAWSSILNTKAKGYVSGVNAHENVQKLRRRKKACTFALAKKRPGFKQGFKKLMVDAFNWRPINYSHSGLSLQMLRNEEKLRFYACTVFYIFHIPQLFLNVLHIELYNQNHRHCTE